jgi:hypothetical protein
VKRVDPAEQARVRRALELKEYRLMDLPGYTEWSEKLLAEPALLAHMDSQNVILHPSELGGPHTELFEEMLSDLRARVGG